MKILLFIDYGHPCSIYFIFTPRIGQIDPAYSIVVHNLQPA